MAIWDRTTQLDKPAERLELAFADLYPESVPADWKRPHIAAHSPAQNPVKKPPAKPAASAATSTAAEEDAGELDSPDSLCVAQNKADKVDCFLTGAIFSDVTSSLMSTNVDERVCDMHSHSPVLLDDVLRMPCAQSF